MVGKITAVLAKKEAEAYSSQGLHHEAIRLYQGLLSASPNIDPTIKSAIQSQIEGLNEEMAATDASKGGPLSHEEISRIRQGWGTQATHADMLVCAHAFFQIGAYDDALKEFKHLLQTAGLKKAYVHGAADCLACRHSPGKVAAEAARLTQTVSSETKPALAMLLAMAKHLAAGSHTAHALALFNHLKRYPALASMADEYLAKLAVAEASQDAPPEPSSGEAVLERPDLSPGRFSLKMVGRLFSRRGRKQTDRK